MFGAVIGDYVGSRYEFANFRSTEFEFFGPGCHFTDDTVCTAAVERVTAGPEPLSVPRSPRW